MRSRATTEERSRRRFARRQWARRWLTWRYVLVAVVLLTAVGGGVYAVYFSDALSVRGVEVVGAETVSEELVLQAAAVPTGGPLARADLDAIARRVENVVKAVRTATVTRSWPDEVRIAVEERVPVALVERGGLLRAVDDQGEVFTSYPTEGRAPEGLPRIRAVDVTDNEALVAAAVVVAALPADLRAQIDHLEVAGVDDIDLVLDDDRTVRWGGAESSEQKAEVLLALLQRPGRVLDVSVPGQPTTSG